MPGSARRSSNAPGPQEGRCDVVVGRESSRLRGVVVNGTLRDAATAHLIARRKIEGIWLYAVDEPTLDHAIEQVLDAALSVCRSWFLARTAPLAGKLAKNLGSVVTMDAARPIIRAYVRSGHLAALPALTNDYDPYVIVYDPADSEELHQILSAATRLLADRGVLTEDAIPSLSRTTTIQVWRSIVISHLEWSGAGRMTSSGLSSWTTQ